MRRVCLSYAWLLGTAAVVLSLDQLTKSLVRANLPLNVPWQPFPALDPIFTFRHIRNTGAAFGLLPGLGTVFMAVAVAVILAIIIRYRKMTDAPMILKLGFGFLVGGAIGNLIDRLRFGYVTDFVDFRWWPVFNVADSAVVIGTVIIVAYMLFAEAGQAHEAQEVSADEC